MTEIPIRVLGGVRLEGPSGSSSVGGPNAERLLGALVVARPGPARADALVEAIWPDTGASIASLRMTVSRLRHRMAAAGLPDAIASEAGGYRLAVPSDRIDIERFRSLAQVARSLVHTEPNRAAAHFDAALALWRGEPFGAHSHDAWAVVAAAAWQGAFLDVEEEAADLELARFRQATVIDRLQLAVERQPLRERRTAQLAVALYRLGRQAEALRAVDRARAHLREQLGTDIGEELRSVEQGVLTQDASLLRSREPPVRHGPLPNLIGRDAEIGEAVELLGTNRVVTIHGLGGVGKSALARHVARRLEDAGHHVVATCLDGISEADEVCLAVATALGLPGASAPADLAAAAAGRGVGAATTLLLDGAEDAAPVVAELVDALAATAPGLTVLITSRAPIGAAGEVRRLLTPLDVAWEDGVSPAMQLFLTRSGVAVHELSVDELRVVGTVCERTAGLPLALEIAAADADACDLRWLQERSEGQAADAVAGAVSWALDALPGESRTVLETASLLPDGMALDGFVPFDRTRPADARRLLGPLLQSRLLTTSGLTAGVVRYRPLEPIRQVVVDAMGEEVRTEREQAVVSRLRAIAASMGGPDRRTDQRAMPAVEAELGNVRHWVARSVGTEAGLDLAVVMAVPMSEIGLGAEGAEWLDDHLAALEEPPPLLWARAVLARLVVRGFFSGTTSTPDDLDLAADIAWAHGEPRMWLALRGRLALARAWAGDVAGASAMLDDPHALAVVRSVRDPWVDAQLDRIRAMFLAARGDVLEALEALQMMTSRFHELDDASSVLSSLYLRSFLARLIGDDERSAADLRRAREMCFTGAARATQALVAAELAQHERRMGQPLALVTMSEAVDALERAGNLRAAAVARRDLGAWRLTDGDPEGLADLRAALPTLLRCDRQAAAPVLAEIAASVVADDPERAALLAGAARAALRTAFGTPPASLDEGRLRLLVEQLTAERASTAEAGGRLDDEQILVLASSP